MYYCTMGADLLKLSIYVSIFWVLKIQVVKEECYEFDNSEKAQNIYSQFSKAPIIKWFNTWLTKVDAQILHQLKLIDRKCHKNPHVKSYAERIYASYERVCKCLLHIPS